MPQQGHKGRLRVRHVLDSVTLADLQNPATWRQLTALVRIKPNSDLLPVRAKYDGRTNTIGLNFLTAEHALWYTLSDCVVSKLLTGKCPKVEEAIRYCVGNRQTGLKPVQILGRQDYSIDPNKDDLFTRLIDLRDEAKANRNSIEKTLKIIANSTSYGIFIEINRDDAPKTENLNIYDPFGNCVETNSKAIKNRPIL